MRSACLRHCVVLCDAHADTALIALIKMLAGKPGWQLCQPLEQLQGINVLSGFSAFWKCCLIYMTYHTVETAFMLKENLTPSQ